MAEQEMKKGPPAVQEGALDIGGTVIFPKETPRAGTGREISFSAGNDGPEVLVMQTSTALRLSCPKLGVHVCIEEDGTVRVDTPKSVIVSPIQLPTAKAS